MKTILAAMLIATSTLAAAQSSQPTIAIIAPSEQTNVIRAGTELMLTMKEGLTTEGKKLRPGQQFRMEVASPLMAGGNIVIPAGSIATGEVTDVRNKGMWGKSGRINARILYVRVGDRQIRLSGSFDDKGVTGTAGVVGALVVIPVAGFFVTGTSAKVPIGTPIKAFLDEDLTVTFASKKEPINIVPVQK